jgi:ATPase subunit of ABC transporter with duplicated ATPase domains
MLAKELEWVRQNPKARQAKNKARVQRYEELASREFQERNETNEIYIPPGERLGDVVIDAKGLRKAYGDRLLFDNLNFNLPKGGIVGIIGPNGAGKTTLFRMMAGLEKPDAGRNAARALREAGLRRPVAPVAQRQEHRVAGDLGRPRHDQGRQLRDHRRAVMSAASTSRAPGQQQNIGDCRVASATACTLPRS